MKGLLHIPNLKKLAKSYETLQLSKSPLAIPEICKMSQWTRLDPRLQEQLIQNLAHNWKVISPVELNAKIINEPWPQALAVCLEQVELIIQNEKKLYQNWKKTVLTGIQPVPFQNFFIGLRPLAGKSVEKTVRSPLRPFSKWGFAEDELQLGKVKKWPSRVVGRQTREQKLKEYLTQNSFWRFSIQDYIHACYGAISKRQALRDLNAFTWIQKIGSTKGRRYKIK